MSHTANGRRVVTISLIFFMVANLIWLGMPFGMAILWSLVDAAHPWSYPDIFPPVLSFSRWLLVWEKTSACRGAIEQLHHRTYGSGRQPSAVAPHRVCLRAHDLSW